MSTLIQDIRFAFRTLRKRPGFTAAAVLALALGIGGTTFVFSAVNALLLRPLPVAEPDRLATLHEERRGRVVTRGGLSALPYERYEALREATSEVFTDVAGQVLRSVSVRTGGEAQALVGTLVTANYFDVLGVRPATGRFFGAGQAAGAVPEAVIGHDLWRREFGADPDVVGRTVVVDSRPLTVVGVAPADFGGTMVGLTSEIWIPERAYARLGDGGSRLTLFARLRPGVTVERAGAVVDAASKSLPPADAETEVVSSEVATLDGMPAFARGPVTGFLGLLLAAAGLVLLIASTNVGGMLLARATSRAREIAVRRAMGARRGRLIRTLLTESALLSVVGGGAGLLLAVWLAEAAARVRVPGPMRITLDFGLDGRVLAFALAVSLATGLLFGLVPAIRATRRDVAGLLRGDERGATRRRTRLRSAFVVAQVAMSLVLLVTAGLFVRTLRTATSAELGYDTDDVAVASMSLEPHGYGADEGRAFYRRLMERIRGVADVEAAGLAMYAPFSGNVSSAPVRRPDDAEDGATYVHYDIVGPGFFETLGLPVVAGRGVRADDRRGAPPVVVVNEALARTLWPGESPLGRRIVAGSSEYEVVGVTADAKLDSFRDRETPFLFFPFGQRYAPTMTVLARTRAGTGAGLAALREEVAAIDPDIALAQAMPLSDLVGFFLMPQRLASAVVGLFGLIGLLLAAVGIYGVLAFQVAQRTREIGVRVALGARARDVSRLVVRHGALLAVTGIALGALAAFALTRLLSSLLYGVSATDPVTFCAVAVLLTGVALLASYIPARRAARVDPMTALRAD